MLDQIFLYSEYRQTRFHWRSRYSSMCFEIEIYLQSRHNASFVLWLCLYIFIF